MAWVVFQHSTSTRVLRSEFLGFSLIPPFKHVASFRLGEVAEY